MNIEDFKPPGDKSPMTRADRDVHASVAEGHRLVVAFTKIKDQSDRHIVIDLAEWLGN